MTAFVLLQRRLLRATGGRLPLLWLLSTAHLANAIAFAVPFAGSGFMWALLNWIADALCLVLAIRAVGRRCRGTACCWYGALGSVPGASARRRAESASSRRQ